MFEDLEYLGLAWRALSAKGTLGTAQNGEELPQTITEVPLIAGKQHYYLHPYQYHHRYERGEVDGVGEWMMIF